MSIGNLQSLSGGEESFTAEHAENAEKKDIITSANFAVSAVKVKVNGRHDKGKYGKAGKEAS